ncbi:hypothetical protein DNTS_009805 [Danionella cerebrum]|uniref:Interferon gamma n=1 Tax=Danionella cerebrum TaxID=2873325 RepID=A0A553MY78_9TELE|nr:hypothetical protein DNTS_009805 [Danionella translucida]
MMGFFWAVCFLTMGWAILGEASVPDNLDKSIDELKKHFIKDDHKLHDSHPIFLRILKDLKVNLEESEQSLLMSIIMDTYSRILTQMQNDSLDEGTKMRLVQVQEHLKKLQESYFPGKSAELKRYAEMLWAVKENNPLVQSKALFELKRVFGDALLLKNQKNKERKRRQAKNSRRRSLKRA